MPSPTERNTKRRKRAAAGLGVLLVVAGGLAYAATRDGSSDTGQPSGIAAPALPSASDPASGATDGGTSTAAASDPAASAGTATSNPTPPPTTSSHPGTTAPPVTDTTSLPPDPADPAFDPASRHTTPPGSTPATFTVTGDPAGTFRPGVSQPIDLSITNPNGSDLTVTAVTVAVGPSSVPGCGAGNLVVVQQFSGTVVVPAHATRSLSALNVPVSQRPVLTMPNSAVSQDVCQQATFPLTYTGTGSVTS